MIPVLLSCLTVAILSWFTTRWLADHALPLRLIQAPNSRSSHSIPTPTGGGAAFVLTASLGFYLTDHTGLMLPEAAPSTITALGIMVFLAAILALVGLIDDIRHLPAIYRFLSQLALCLILLLSIFCVSGDRLTPTDYFHLAILLVSGLWWVNLFNFMDGIDGLAASQGIFMIVTAAGLLLWTHPSTHQHPLIFFMLLVGSATAGFLAHNWAPARIFMGDAGSTWLAFIIFGVALISHRNGWVVFPVWVILAAVFITDATLTLFSRWRKGENLLEGHRSHAYQLFATRLAADRLNSHRMTTGLIMGINIFWLAPWALFTQLRPDLSPLTVFFAYTPIAIGVIKVRSGDRNAKNNTPTRRETRD